MKTLLPIFLLSLLFAYATERTTNGKYLKNEQSYANRVYFFLLVLTLTLPVGLRRMYNDTGAYINSFTKSMDLSRLLVSDELHILGNPAFNIYESLVRSYTDNYHIFLMIPAAFVQYAFASTIRRYSSRFTLGIGLYFCLGSYVLSMAAMKQTIATAIVLLALPFLTEKKFVRYYLLVFLAFLFHTYAIAFAVLPLFINKPWNFRTFLLLLGTLFVMNNFESIIGSFLEYANERGKAVAEYEVFDNAQINIFRVLVYTVVPLSALLLRRYLFYGDYPKQYNVLINMSIISCAFMSLGTVSGANMFGRMGNYFEIGIICSLTWIIERAFSRRSARWIKALASACFLFYFFYAYKIAMDFDAEYRAVTIMEFIQSLLSF